MDNLWHLNRTKKKIWIFVIVNEWMNGDISHKVQHMSPQNALELLENSPPFVSFEHYYFPFRFLFFSFLAKLLLFTWTTYSYNGTSSWKLAYLHLNNLSLFIVRCSFSTVSYLWAKHMVKSTVSYLSRIYFIVCCVVKIICPRMKTGLFPFIPAANPTQVAPFCRLMHKSFILDVKWQIISFSFLLNLSYSLFIGTEILLAVCAVVLCWELSKLCACRCFFILRKRKKSSQNWMFFMAILQDLSLIT